LAFDRNGPCFRRTRQRASRAPPVLLAFSMPVMLAISLIRLWMVGGVGFGRLFGY
jgi:hypothetical protein